MANLSPAGILARLKAELAPHHPLDGNFEPRIIDGEEYCYTKCVAMGWHRGGPNPIPGILRYFKDVETALNVSLMIIDIDISPSQHDESIQCIFAECYELPATLRCAAN